MLVCLEGPCKDPVKSESVLYCGSAQRLESACVRADPGSCLQCGSLQTVCSTVFVLKRSQML